MLTRRELFRRVIALPVLAGLAPMLTRKRAIPWAIGRCEAKPGDVTHILVRHGQAWSEHLDERIARIEESKAYAQGRIAQLEEDNEARRKEWLLSSDLFR